MPAPEGIAWEGATYLRSGQAGFNFGLLHRLLRLVHCDFEVRGAALEHLGHACRHLGLMLVQRRLQPGVPQALLRGCDLLLHPQRFRILCRHVKNLATVRTAGVDHSGALGAFASCAFASCAFASLPS